MWVLLDRLGAILRESVKMSHIACVDHILLLAREADSLEELLSFLAGFLSSTGLEINFDKSFTSS